MSHLDLHGLVFQSLVGSCRARPGCFLWMKLGSSVGELEPAKELLKMAREEAGELPSDTLKRVRSEGCVLRRQPLVRNSPMPLTSCYRLEEIIGRGSFGSTVFAATDVLSGVRRVVKCVRKEEPEGIRLWRNEVRFLRTLDHPNILRLFEIFEESRAVYQVTETCHGGDLHQWVDRRLRRRRRHARKGQDSQYLQAPHKSSTIRTNPPPEQMTLFACGRGEGRTNESAAIESGGLVLQERGSLNGPSHTVDARRLLNMDAAHDDAAADKCGPAISRLSSTRRTMCPAALGAAAAAATAAVASTPTLTTAQHEADAPAAPPAPPLVKEELATRLMGQVLCALRYLHEKEIAHCDIKLENLLLLTELEDSEAGDGQSSDEEETELRREEQEQQRRLVAQQQQQEVDAAALSRARRGVRARSSVQLGTFDARDSSLSKAMASSSSVSSLSVVPMVLRKRRSCRDARERPVDDSTGCNSSSQYIIEGLSHKDVAVKLADFGLARKIVRTKPFKHGRTVCEGTLYYRSPWIIRGLTDGDARSDLWALGVALFILLSGAPPFDGTDEQEVEKAISETPVSFRGGVWSSVSLRCVGFLRALLYNPILPLHLRGPPPPPPYTRPTADLMLKHPWIQQCVREQRRRGLMRALSAPSMHQLWNASRGLAAADGVPHYPSTNVPGCDGFYDPSRTSVRGCWELMHPSQRPSEQYGTNQIRLNELAHPFASASGGTVLHSTPPAQCSSSSNIGAGVLAGCRTCTSWNCVFGCCSMPHQCAGPSTLRICWGRAPLVTGEGLALYPQQRQHQLQQPGSGSQEGVQQISHSSSADIVVDQPPVLQVERQDISGNRVNVPKACCVLQAAGVSSLVCTTCEGTEPGSFRYEDVPAQAVAEILGTDSDGDAEQLQPHLRLLRACPSLHGLESCAAATNAAAAAAAAAAGVAMAVHREAEKRISEQLRPPLANVPHFHLGIHNSYGCLQTRFRSQDDGTSTDSAELQTRATHGPCCIAVVDWLTAELFEARVPLLLQACAWLDFARLSPLQRALRSVVVKLMEEDIAVKLVRDVMWVLDPQQSGSVSRHCLLDSLKVVKDFFSLEYALRGTEEDGNVSGAAEAVEEVAGDVEPLRVTISPSAGSQISATMPNECEPASISREGCEDKVPASPLQAMQMFASLSPGELPRLDVLKPYFTMLRRALEPQTPAAAGSTEAGSCKVEASAQGSSGSLPSDASTSTGDGVGHRCELDEALVCLDTDGSGGVEFDEFLAASMIRSDFKEREPSCSVAFRLLDRNVDGFISVNDLLSILHFDSHSNLQGVLQAQKQRADAAVAACRSAIAAAEASGEPFPPGILIDDSELVTGRDEHGTLMSVPAGVSFILQLENVSAATVQLYVEVARELKAIQHRSNGLWTFEEFMDLL
ncbi:hypothetical protein Esti_004577 [Eimeria stiedai]